LEHLEERTLLSTTITITEINFFNNRDVIETINGIPHWYVNPTSPLVIPTGSEGSTVDVQDTSQGIAIVLNSGGPDTVTVGNAGSLQKIQAAVTVLNQTSHTELIIDDTADADSHAVTVTNGGVIGLAPAAITYDQNALSSLFVESGSSKNNLFSVDSTPQNTAGVFTDIYNGGAGQNYIDVYGTEGPLDLDGRAGFQNINVGEGWTDGILGSVYAYNTSSIGSSYLTIDDHLDTIGRTADLYSGALTGLGTSATIFWTPSASQDGGVTDVAVLGGSGGNGFTVHDTGDLYMGTFIDSNSCMETSTINVVDVLGTTGSLGIDGGWGYQNVVVGVGSTANIHGSVDVWNSGLTGFSFLSVQDMWDTTGRTADLNYGELTGLGMSVPLYWTPLSSQNGGVTYLSLYGGTGNNVFDVHDTNNFSSGTYLSTGSGASSTSNTVEVYSTSGPLFVDGGSSFQSVGIGLGTTTGIGGEVHVYNSNPGGYSDLIVNDSKDATGRTADLYNGELTGLGMSAPVFWKSSATKTGGVTLMEVYGGTGGNTFNVHDTSKFFKQTYIGSAGGNTSNENIVNVLGTTGTLDVDGRFGSQAVYVGEGWTDGIHGTVDVYNSGPSGYSYLYVNDAFDATGRTADLYNGELTGLGMSAPVFWKSSATKTGGVTYLAVYGGPGKNTFTVVNTSKFFLDSFLDAGLGSSTVRIVAATGALQVHGNWSDTTLVGPNGTNIWDITGPDSGSLGVVSFNGIANLIGGAGDDEFVFSPAGKISGKIDGGPGGNDWLDYWACTAAVVVNLATGSATDVDNGAVGRIANIRNVRGSQGESTLTGNSLGNVLIGGGGINKIYGGSGRSILIADKGASTITGGAGDDILIGGYTTYDSSGDANDQALMKIMDEWQSADSYATRKSKIKLGVGPMHAKFVVGTTVFSNGKTNSLDGGGGNNWILP
jgi:hypothetical protein